MSDVLSMTVREFTAATAAKHPTPGGGAVASLCGALAAALGAMALEYTAGKKAFADHDAEIRAALAQFQRAREMLLELVAEDIAAYEGLSVLLKLPQADRMRHPDYIAAVVTAIRVPQAAAAFALNLLTLCETMKNKTNAFLLSDLAIAAVYAHATVHASEFNVRVNLPLLPNKHEATALRNEMTELRTKADQIYEALHSQFIAQVGG